MKHFILGGARSGKSRYAETQALAHQQDPCEFFYIATATVGDAAMQTRIQRHRDQRASCWRLIEEPLALAEVLRVYNQSQHYLLIDCLTLWLSNALHQGNWPSIKAQFMQALRVTQANVFMVSNEVGQGVVPMGELSRQFVDESGWLHQELAALCERVTLVVAGLPMPLKGLNN